MDWQPLPVTAPLSAYDAQAATLLAAWRAGDPGAVSRLRHALPRFLREDAPWLPRPMSDAEVLATPLDIDDARMATARAYDVADWPALVDLVETVQDRQSPIARFEAAVDALVEGDLAALRGALAADRSLVLARSTRRTRFDPPLHGATLLHYVSANGVEGYRQRTPANLVEGARLLLDAGADPDALAQCYGGAWTTMSLLVSSTPPARAGLQVALVDLLADFGARVEPLEPGISAAPLRTALTFGFLDAARALVRRGARVTSLADAAGLGDRDAVDARLPGADQSDRHLGLALAAALGHASIVQTLLDAGVDPNRYNPPNAHAHSTPLHQAVAAGHLEVVRLLVERGAHLHLRDTLYDATPLGWAEYLHKADVAMYLRERRAGR